MKKILFFLLMTSFQTYGQELLLDVLPLHDHKVVFKNVKEVLGDSKLLLTNKAIEWFEENKLQIDQEKALDESHDLISGLYVFQELWGPNDYPELYKKIQCRISLTVKNERYQYKISNFVVKEPQQETQLEIYQMDQKKLQKYNPAFYKRIDTKMKDLIFSIESKMKQTAND